MPKSYFSSKLVRKTEMRQFTMAGEVEILVRLYGPFLEAVGKGELRISCPRLSSLRALLELLRQSLGEKFEALLLNENGNLQDDVLLLLNNKVLSIRDMDLKLNDGDELCLIKVISSG
jgi:molybdopterin converting factor small subunit